MCSLKDPYTKGMTRYLPSRSICCPYCRQVVNKLLPIIPTINLGYTLPKYVASATNCIKHKSCEYCYKSGKQKGKKCGANGFEYNGSFICLKHWKAAEKKKDNAKSASKKSYMKKDLSGKALELFNKYKVTELKEQLKLKKARVSGNKATLAERLSKLSI